MFPNLSICNYNQFNLLFYFYISNPSGDFFHFLYDSSICRWQLDKRIGKKVTLFFLAQIDSVRGHSTTTWTEFCHFLIPPLRWQFLYSEHGQKQTFFDPLPPHVVHVVIEWPLRVIQRNPKRLMRFLVKPYEGFFLRLEILIQNSWFKKNVSMNERQIWKVPFLLMFLGSLYTIRPSFKETLLSKINFESVFIKLEMMFRL